MGKYYGDTIDEKINRGEDLNDDDIKWIEDESKGPGIFDPDYPHDED